MTTRKDPTYRQQDHAALWIPLPLKITSGPCYYQVAFNGEDVDTLPAGADFLALPFVVMNAPCHTLFFLTISGIGTY